MPYCMVLKGMNSMRIEMPFHTQIPESKTRYLLFGIFITAKLYVKLMIIY